MSQIALKNVLILGAVEGKMHLYEREREKSSVEDWIAVYKLGFQRALLNFDHGFTFQMVSCCK